MSRISSEFFFARMIQVLTFSWRFGFFSKILFWISFFSPKVEMMSFEAKWPFFCWKREDQKLMSRHFKRSGWKEMVVRGSSCTSWQKTITGSWNVYRQWNLWALKFLAQLGGWHSTVVARFQTQLFRVRFLAFPKYFQEKKLSMLPWLIDSAAA